MKKLAAARIDTSSLHSSRNLGISKTSKRQISSRPLMQDKAIGSQKVDEIPATNELVPNAENSELDLQPNRYIKSNEPSSVRLGSGLKRSIETDSDGNPIIEKRRRLDSKKRKLLIDFEPPWEGFSSSNEDDVSSAHLFSGSQPFETHRELSDGTEEVYMNSDNSTDDIDDRSERSSAFKIWASQRVNEALGFFPAVSETNSSTSNQKPTIDIKPREPELDPLPLELQTVSQQPMRKAFSVEVDRPSEIQDARLSLPVVADEQKIMEAIFNNSAVIIWGATGSGKTTQIPQFLFEAGFGNPDSCTPGMIGVTQPRRVAAVSMAKRVGDELGSASSKVAYQIRFESSVSDTTAIKFMTDGILVREIAKDFALLSYSVIIIDEAHERSVNTDILIGMVSRIVDLRASMSKDDDKITPLKLIIMSATLRVADFMDNPNLFRSGPPPLIQSEGRQYPVSIHFARRTQRDYLEEAFQKISKGHKMLPPGGMLVFLTGQNEITALAKRLEDNFENHRSSMSSNRKVRITATEAPLETEDFDFGDLSSKFDELDNGDNEEDGEFEEGDDQAFEIGEDAPSSSRIQVLPLYSQLQTKDQLRVFEPSPANTRIIVLATNVAETSLTIPGIRYVFDCGRVKDKKYNQTTGVQSFEIGWISKASASQRAGRAGRTGPGHCYRLYSSAMYERDFTEHAEPEIMRMPVEGVVLQLKSMDLQHVVNFPFPTPPDRQSLIKAEKLLTYLGAISTHGKITPVGRELSIYPLSPRFSKMLLIGYQHGCMPYTIAMVAALAVQELFIPENQLDLSSHERTDAVYSNADRLADSAREQRRKSYNRAQRLFSKNSDTSDGLKALTAVCAYAHAPDPSTFCAEMFLNSKSLKEASLLRQQLSGIVHSNHPTFISNYQPQLPPPSGTQLKALQQILASAFIDQVAVRADLSPSPPDVLKKPSRTINVPYLPLFPSHTGRATDLLDIAVFIHPASVLAHISPAELPQYIVYSHLQRGAPATIQDSKIPKTRMHPLAAVSGKQLTALARDTPLLRYGKPIGKVVEEAGGKRECWVVPELVGEQGRTGWPLPAIKVKQRKLASEGWVIEKILE